MVDIGKLIIDRKEIIVWQSATVTKSIENLTGVFSFSLKANNNLRVYPSSTLQFYVNNKIIIDGYIDSVSYGIDTVTIQGRDKTSDLVDCSAIVPSGQFNNITFEDLIRSLLLPFGVDFIIESEKAKTKIEKVTIDQATVFEVIDKEARKLGLLAYSSLEGKLTIAEVNQADSNTFYSYPGNILNYEASQNFAPRYSNYFLKAQQRSKSTLSNEQSSQVKAESKDLNIKRYRPLNIIGESQMNLQQAQDRVNWESSVRVSRTAELNLDLAGLADYNGVAWSPNTSINVNIPNLNLRSKMLIKTVETNLSVDGRNTKLTLINPKSLIPQPEIPEEADTDKVLP